MSITRGIFFKPLAERQEDKEGRQVPDLFLFFKKALYEEKISGLQLSFNIFRYPLSWLTIKTDCIKFYTIDPEICSILIF